jgi:hypothetical protein
LSLPQQLNACKKEVEKSIQAIKQSENSLSNKCLAKFSLLLFLASFFIYTSVSAETNLTCNQAIDNTLILAENNPTQAAAPKDTIVQNTPAQDKVMENTPVQNTPAKNTTPNTAATNPSTPDNSWPSKVRLFAGGASHGRGIYYIDYLVPLYYSEDKDNLLFFNPKERLDSPFEEETNLGLGFRKVFNDNFILGLNYFYDKNYSINDKLYSQNGCGFEILSQSLDIRFNYYKPITGAKVVDTTYEFGSTSLLETNNREEPLEGFDFEFGGPVFDRYTKTKVYVGGFFYNSKLSKDLRGERVRTETNLNNWLSIDNILERTDNGKLNVTSGIRVTIPFELGRVRTGGNPLRTAPVTSYIEDRIFDRVVRDLDVRASSSNQASKAHDLTYVDNSNTNPFPNGTLTNPYTTIQAAIANATGDKWIFVNTGLSQNPASYYTGGVTLSPDMVLWGAGYNGGFNGLTVSGIAPVISGGTSVITLANNNTVMGCQIQNDQGVAGINGTDIAGTVNINHNIITDNYDGIFLTTPGSNNLSAIISDNIISGNAYDGINLSNNYGTMSGFTISGNTVNGNAYDGIDLSINSGTMLGFIISSNTANGNGYDGIDLGNNYGVTMSGFIISGNTANGNGNDGIELVAFNFGGTISGFNISGNTANGNGREGINLAYNFGTISDFTISGNTANGNGTSGIGSYNNSGIELTFNYGTMSGFIISGNTANGNINDGIDLRTNQPGGSMSYFTISGNTANGNAINGIDLSGNSGSISDVTFLHNTVTGNYEDGIILSNNGGTISGINFGNGTAGGYNSIYNNNQSANGFFDIDNNSGINGLLAEYNWWGRPDPQPGQFGGVNTVDYTYPLPLNPNRLDSFGT